MEKGKDLLDYTKKLQETASLDELVKGRQRGMIRYQTVKGSVYGIGLFKNNEAAVQLAIMTKGTVFPEHSHKDPVRMEYIHVIKGKITVHTCEGMKEVRETESIAIKSGILHKVEALEDTEVIAITMPADEGFPDGAK